jgi:hypothetical protein
MEPRFHYCVHNSLPLVHILSHKNPIQKSPPYLFKIHFNIILAYVVLCNISEHVAFTVKIFLFSRPNYKMEDHP